MGTSAFQQGVQVTFQGKTYDILRKITDDIWQLEEVRSKRIYEHSDEELRKFYANHQLTFVTSAAIDASDKSAFQAHREFTPEQWENAKIRLAYVRAILDLPNTRSKLVAVIQEIWQQLGKPQTAPDPATVIRWKAKYIKAGKDITNLIEQYGRKGNREERYSNDVTRLVQEAINTVYLKREGGSVKDVLDRAEILVKSENKLLPDALQLPLPTRRLVTRMIEAIPAFDRCAARQGRTAAVKRFRSVLAHRTTAAPLERAEIDHTLLDLMVIDDKSGLPLGRPWVTACIDDYTRCLLGIHISFEPPSYLTVAHCLRAAFLPKANLKDQYPSIQNAWEAHGVMRELVVDNGTEFHSNSLENACYSLGIEIHYSARKTPWFKGKIERFLGTLNAAIAHGNPGTTFRNIFDKEEYDPSKHAVIRLSKLQEIIRMWIVDVYHQKPHRTLNAPPAAVWRSSISSEEILIPDDPAQLDAILGHSEERRLTHKGIELYGLLYNSPELTTLRMKLGDKLDVEVRVDGADIGHIIVLSPDKTRMFKVPALSFNYANGLSVWQHRVCKRFAARELDKYDSTSWLKAKLTISKFIEDEFMHKKQKTRTKIARYKGATKPITVEQPETPAPHPVPQSEVKSIPAEPLTPADISDETSQPAQTGKKFKPVYRERSQHLIESDQSDVNIEVSHD